MSIGWYCSTKTFFRDISQQKVNIPQAVICITRNEEYERVAHGAPLWAGPATIVSVYSDSWCLFSIFLLVFECWSALLSQLYILVYFIWIPRTCKDLENSCVHRFFKNIRKLEKIQKIFHHLRKQKLGKISWRKKSWRFIKKSKFGKLHGFK